MKQWIHFRKKRSELANLSKREADLDLQLLETKNRIEKLSRVEQETVNNLIKNEKRLVEIEQQLKTFILGVKS
ncbi:hypothetical protein [Sporolactobacillus pectinivorans]|uniref:hypothetical protein n=1 Tax=Sporolactobacillus pectinivorans TaxID=1591408 RepID=UPI000C257F8C|nr:hypothetical protein [Sporolactobacillus pectinivorans]